MKYSGNGIKLPSQLLLAVYFVGPSKQHTQDFVPVIIPSCFVPFLTYGFLLVGSCF